MSSFDANQGWNACMSKFVLNSGIGSVVGATVGFFFFKQRIPIILYFTGIGGGWAIIDCNNQFKALKSLQAKTSHGSPHETPPREPPGRYIIDPPSTSQY